VLPNGLRVFLLEDHELGLVGGQLLVKGGTSRVPKEKVSAMLVEIPIRLVHLPHEMAKNEIRHIVQEILAAHLLCATS
jgi:hypothetical protein